MKNFFKKYKDCIILFIICVCQTLNLVWCLLDDNINKYATWFAGIADCFCILGFIGMLYLTYKKNNYEKEL